MSFQVTAVFSIAATAFCSVLQFLITGSKCSFLASGDFVYDNRHIKPGSANQSGQNISNSINRTYKFDTYARERQQACYHIKIPTWRGG